jgi:hypothetical protein
VGLDDSFVEVLLGHGLEEPFSGRLALVPEFGIRDQTLRLDSEVLAALLLVQVGPKSIKDGFWLGVGLAELGRDEGVDLVEPGSCLSSARFEFVLSDLVILHLDEQVWVLGRSDLILEEFVDVGGSD